MLPTARLSSQEKHSAQADYFCSVRDKTTILMVGSSHFSRFLTTGSGLITEKSVVVAGIGGDRIRDIHWRLCNPINGFCTLIRNRPGIPLRRIVIIAGGNDLTGCKKPKSSSIFFDEYVPMINQVLEMLDGSGIGVDLVTIPFPRARHRVPSDADLFAATGMYNTLIQAHARSRNLGLVDIGIETIDDACERQRSDLFDDEVHLNRAGYEKFFGLLNARGEYAAK